MKCIDCKFCAFINGNKEQITVKSNGIETTWGALNGAYCMKTICVMMDVAECTGYEKSKHKKIKV